jgi:hypothetical protein
MRRNVQRRSGSVLTTGNGMLDAPKGRGVRAMKATLPTPPDPDNSTAVLVESPRVTLDNIPIVQLDYGRRRGWGLVDVGLYLVGVAGLSASLTILWLGMRAILDVGGYCAEGGPYVIAQHCPADTALLIPLSIFAGLGSAALMAWEGAKLGSPWAALVGLAWPALFISLGWNFLEFAFLPPEGMNGVQLGWLIPGVLFVVMGAVPLIAFLPGGKTWSAAAAKSTFGDAEQGEYDVDRQRERLVNDLAAYARKDALRQQGGAIAAAVTDDSDSDLVTKLERLDALHRSGALTYDEFQKAKAALLPGGSGA